MHGLLELVQWLQLSQFQSPFNFGQHTSPEGELAKELHLPDWLIRDNNLRPIFRLFRNSIQLGCHYINRLVAFSLLVVVNFRSCARYKNIRTSNVSPTHKMTPKSLSRAVLVFLAIN